MYKQIEINENYKLVDNQIEYNHGIITARFKNRVIRILFMQEIEDDENNSCSSSSDEEYNDKNRIIQEIIQNKAITACDSSVSQFAMGGY